MTDNIELQDLVFLRGLGGHGLITARVTAVKAVPDLAAGGCKAVKYVGTILTSSDPNYRPQGHVTLTCLFTPDLVLDVLKVSSAWREP